ncbi:TetR family transcriptional regulator [Streptosporangium sp. NPDC048047]|uniref:TetR/AcrR family transcriptional regulator n=1 Tax=Streptosporangium sp. NPDC048047 TaxID=3155748 RepID=UPI0034366C5D
MGKLTREAVVERALEIGDAEGLQAVTIRRLAQELGVTPMALYWHFKNKEQLVIGMADHLVEGFEITHDGSRAWQEQLRELVGRLIRVLRRHPCAEDVLKEVDKMDVPAFLRVWDTALGLALRARFGPQESCLITRYILQGAIALAGGSTEHFPDRPDEEREERVRLKRVRFQSLPPDAYPTIVRMAEPLSEGGDAELYDAFGVDLLLSGIESMAARLGD